MKNFAIIAEGITDQAVLEHILYEFYEKIHNVEIAIRSLAPLRDATDANRVAKDVFGGWEQVLEYCAQRDIISQAIEQNDYLVIQIDTDCAEHQNFGVMLTENGKDRKISDIINDAKEIIIRKIGKDIYGANTEKFLFAIAVHSIECWVLPLHCNDHNSQRIKSCEDHLVRILDKNNKRLVKDYKFYKNISRGLGRIRTIRAVQQKSISFNVFVANLPPIVR